jgi:hypothetical protein
VQTEDDKAQVGVMLATMLDYAFASLVNSIEVLDGGKLKISREPRYLGMHSIRQVASLDIPASLWHWRSTGQRHPCCCVMFIPYAQHTSRSMMRRSYHEGERIIRALNQ